MGESVAIFIAVEIVMEIREETSELRNSPATSSDKDPNYKKKKEGRKESRTQEKPCRQQEQSFSRVPSSRTANDGLLRSNLTINISKSPSSDLVALEVVRA